MDNTVKESKNNTVYKLLSFILLQKGLELVGICMSRVGHTHGCLGILDLIFQQMETTVSQDVFFLHHRPTH